MPQSRANIEDRSYTLTMGKFRIPLRFVGLALGLIVGVTAGNILNLVGDSDGTRSAIFAVALAIGGIGYLIGPHLSWAVFRRARQAITETSTVDIVAIAVGLVFGAVVSAALAFPTSFLPDPIGTFVPLIIAIACCGFSIAVVLVRKRDLIEPWFRVKSPKPAPVAPTKKIDAAPAGLLLDTNVIIDGRITSVVESGFIDSTLNVPRFVLDELQRIADSDDPMRRTRGRRGLETLNQLRAEQPAKVMVIDELVPEEREVDAKLVKLAKRRGERILTNDFNLNRVAQLQDVRVLNLNELTNALRPIVLPGEEISLKVVQEGREAGQGVGFLDDGTMVVVDGGRGLVGQQIPVTITRLLQTGAGRMVFATPKHANGA